MQPQETVDINLQVQPQKWWRRPLIGGGRIINFCVDLEDLQHLPIPNNSLPGVLVWEARPLWQLLPFLLLGLLGVGAVAYLIWWVLFRIPPSPKIVELYPEDNTYSAVNGDVVHLGWQISDVNRLQTLKMVGLSVDGTPLTRLEVYDFNQGVPAVLQPFCIQKQSSLTCRQVRTNARKSATYVFEMTHIIRLNAQGWNVPAIAKIFECHEHTVRATLRRWSNLGLGGLWETSGRGAKCKWLEADLAYLEDCLELEPRTYNSLQLSEKLAQDRNVQLSPSRLRRLLKKKVEMETHPSYS